MERKHHYLAFLPSNNLDDIAFFDEKINEEYEKQYSPVDTLLEFANLCNESTVEKVKQIVAQNEEILETESFVNAVYDSMVSDFGSSVSDLIMLGIKNQHEAASIIQIKLDLVECASGLIESAKTYCDSIVFEGNRETGYSPSAAAIATISSTLPPRIMYCPFPALSKSTGNIVFCDCFLADDPQIALYLSFVLCIRNGDNVRQCKICGKYFVPASKSNEIYCKDCRNTTYDTKVKNDEILKAYRTIYKTQNARKQRNMHRKDISAKFDKWKEYAKEKLAQCQNREITLDEMKDAISLDEWMESASV